MLTLISSSYEVVNVKFSVKDLIHTFEFIADYYATCGILKLNLYESNETNNSNNSGHVSDIAESDIDDQDLEPIMRAFHLLYRFSGHAQTIVNLCEESKTSIFYTLRETTPMLCHNIKCIFSY